MATAKFSQSRNDMYWTHFDLDDGFIRWIGYDDANWWENVAPKADTSRVGKESGRTYTLDYNTCEVLITEQVPA